MYFNFFYPCYKFYLAYQDDQIPPDWTIAEQHLVFNRKMKKY